MAKITKGYIDKVQAPAEGYKIHWDESVRGYGLRIMASGKRVFIAQGRVRGKPVIVTLGPYGVLTEDQARKKAQKALQDMREGIDPRDAKKADEAAAVTLRTVATEYKNRPGKLKESSKEAIERHVVTTLAIWKDKPIVAITEDACRQQYRKMLDGGLRGKRKDGSPGQANQAFSVLRALINYAGRRYRRADGSPLILRNPVDGLKDDWVELQPKTSMIPMGKVGAVWAALQQWRTEAYTRDSLAGIDIVTLLLLTGCRWEEMASMRWEQVHLEEDAARCWMHLPDTKNKNPVWLPLSSQAVELLKTRQRVERSPFVFTTWSKAGYIRSARELMEKVSKVAGERVTPHDLRRTYITVAVSECSIDLYRAELLTNHVPKGVTARHYLETSRLQYLHPEAQCIGDWIEVQAVKASGANVVQLRA
ncbi:integrase family protein [Rhizobium sp. ICMP 5592]|uniref:tyrosine-type recombinase/integrase n=1 Tax=Rhizobium sp. ICMP 5592 TaxID=2292445 RepID=UPI00129691E9|nr:integrase family protein [Rhizobium sp. ICMP 5592]MQB43036.1 DUF4102 domain-containing protein [Rhizobium sp. ICMP 5592]